ncbi:MAG: alpha/beta hydrolase family protein [Caldilineaceae bacterium]
MRPFEILLSLTNLLAFCLLALPLPGGALWPRYWVLIAVLIAVTQVLMEGARWQMFPAYALTGIFFLIWLVQNNRPLGGVTEQSLTHRLVVGLGVGLGVLGLVAAVALPIILPVFHFPQPSGPYAIGTLTYHWVDGDRPEIFTTDPAARRELMVQIWYPAKPGTSSAPAPYLQDADVVTTALARLHNFPDFTLKHFKYVRTNAAEALPIAADQPSYPVLIFLEGVTGYRQMNTFQVEELVSHGYIVVGIDQPGAAAAVVFPDGDQIAITERFAQIDLLIDQSLAPVEKAPQFNGQPFKDGIIPYFAQDVSFTLDQLATLNNRDPNNILTEKLDLQHTGVFGMSLGGIVSAEACLKEPRLQACLIMDVAMSAHVVQQGLQQPSMWITRPADTMRLERAKAGGWAEQDIEQTQTTMRAMYNSLPSAGYFVQVPGMFHIDLTDVDLVSPLAQMIGFSGPIGSQRAHSIINVYTLAFFDRHLKGRRATLLDGPTEQYPDVIFEMRRP